MGRVLTGMIAAAYVTDNPAGVARDGAAGRITGARLYLHSYVDLYGTASHVVTGANPSVTADGEVVDDRGALAVHVRMLEVLAPAVERMKEHI
ncbi:MAG TPA: hypothetical protein VFE49_05475 [Jiangellaceae bacterium]|jgi:hypothetical protein|nr:hypothetical protein [Jiangellaceae bacterium]